MVTAGLCAHTEKGMAPAQRIRKKSRATGRRHSVLSVVRLYELIIWCIKNLFCAATRAIPSS